MTAPDQPLASPLPELADIAGGHVGVVLNLSQYLGDVICQLPLLEACRQAGAGKVTVFAKKKLGARLAVEAGSADQGLVARRITPSLLREQACDLLINAHPGSLSASWACARSGARTTIGYRSLINRLLLKHCVARDGRVYRARSYLTLAGRGPHPSFSQAIATIASRCQDDLRLPPGPFILVIPRYHHPQKYWGDDALMNWGRATLDAHPTLHLFVHAGPDEGPAAERVVQALGARAQVLTSPSLPQLAQITRAAAAALVFDSGPAHLALLSEIPVVACFGDPRGEAGLIAQHYFDPRPGACALLAAPGCGLQSIPVAVVSRAIARALADPGHAPEFLRLDSGTP